MAKAKSKKSPRKKSAPDRHFFSALVGLILGTGAFYAKRSLDSRSATA